MPQLVVLFNKLVIEKNCLKEDSGLPAGSSRELVASSPHESQTFGFLFSQFLRYALKKIA